MAPSRSIQIGSNMAPHGLVNADKIECDMITGRFKYDLIDDLSYKGSNMTLQGRSHYGNTRIKRLKYGQPSCYHQDESIQI